MSITRLFIEADLKTPEIDLDPETGILNFKGKSIPENATQFYEPIIKWTKEYVKAPKDETHLHFNLVYFNTASSIWMARIIKILSGIKSLEKLLIIYLYFHIEDFDEMEEEDIQEAVAPAFDVINDATVSIGIKVFGTDDFGEILKERLILL